MEIILGLERLNRSLVNPVITLGNFDGVHLGHQKIFQRIKEEAARIGGESVVVTFEPHPLKVLSPENRPPLLSPFRKKMLLIEQSGIDVVLCLTFTAAFSKTPAAQFITDVLVGRLGARKIVVGYNYRFGKGHEGNIETLKRIAGDLGVEVEAVEALKIGRTVVSSSKIRALIREGAVEEAAKLLGRDYLVIGKVVEGFKRGQAALGFPTANLENSDELYPRPGVYAVEVVWNGRSFHGVANVGSNPTFARSGSAQGRSILEVHILDFDRDIYGEEIQVNFRKRIRDEFRFDSAAELIEQIKKDIQWARENVFSKGPGGKAKES